MSDDESRWRRLRATLAERGGAWLAMRQVSRLTARLHAAAESALARIERRKFLTGEGTLSSAGNTLAENREKWEAHDWSRGGEEWTEQVRDFRGLDPVAWKAALIAEVMNAHLETGAAVLEIGPGAGRWTEALAQRAGALHLADISPRCLDLCRQRFEARQDVHYHLLEKPDLPEIDDASIDFVWSYDVFVHINPEDTASYLRSFARVMKPGARAVIHHPGHYESRTDRTDYFRSEIDEGFFEHLAGQQGLVVASRDTEHVHLPGDTISIVRKPQEVMAESIR